MANIKSSKKDIKRSARKTAVNSATKVALKTYIKKTRKAVAAKEPEAIATTLTEAVKRIDKAAQKGVIHPNQAARRKSRIAKLAAAALKAAGK